MVVLGLMVTPGENLYNMKFTKETNQIGDVKVGASVTALFKGTPENGEKITRVQVSCGCIKSNHTDTDVTLSFKVGSIPYHLKRQGYYNGMKKATVYFDKNYPPVVLKVEYTAK